MSNIEFCKKRIAIEGLHAKTILVHIFLNLFFYETKDTKKVASFWFWNQTDLVADNRIMIILNYNFYKLKYKKYYENYSLNIF